MKVGYEGAVAEINLFKPDDGQPFFFVSGTGLAHDENDGDRWVEWEPELVASVADGIRTIADGDKIFYSTGLFINPEFRDEILAYLRDTVDSLPDAERRKLELFHRPVGADEWVAQTEQTMLSEEEETQVEAGLGSEEAEALPIGPFEGAVEPTESETASEETLADGHFLLFWRETSVTAAERLGRALDVISSNQLEGLRRGDTVWVATVEKGDLVVVGRMRVGEVIGREEAERRFGDDNIWKSNFFAVALDSDSCELPRRIYLGDDAYELRFMEDDADRFVKIDGRISRSQTRKMRQLTTGAAKMLVDVWEQDCESEVSDDDLEANVVFLGAGSDSEPEPVEVDGHRLDVFEGCLLGGAVGDALGAAIEFDSIEAIRREHGDDGLTDYAEAYGRIGSVTDDTQMTLFTAEGLLRAECRRSHRGICYPAGVIHHAYLRWLQTQGHILEDEAYTSFVYETPSWLRDVPEMNAVRAPGTTCLDALLSGKRGTPEEPINDRKGCGGVMRVAPIGLIALDPFGLASEAAAITHGHPTGYLSAGVFASVIGGLVKGDSLIDAIENAVYRELPKHEGHEETLAACEKAIRLAKSHLGSADGGFPEDESVPERPGPEAVEALGAGWIAEEALAIALYCSLVHENDFEKALLLSVNHSGDSDSTGSITGNILGTIHGKKGIPDRWLEHLELRGVISELARDLAVGFVDDFEWSRKYPGI
jgi:ADP-ribosylglycohydrolase